MSDAAHELLESSRAAQHLPEHVEDEAVLAQIALLLNANGPRPKPGLVPPATTLGDQTRGRRCG